MSFGKQDKRVDGVAHSSSPSSTRHRISRDHAAWDDRSLFGDGEGEATIQHEDAGDTRAGDSTGNIPSTESRGRRLSTLSTSGASEVGGEEESLPTGAVIPQAQRRQRQPPLGVSSFLLNPDGTPNDGLLSLYCNINYSRDKLHKFKFLDRQEARDARKEEYMRDLRAAQLIIDMNSCKDGRSARPRREELDLRKRHQEQQEVLRAGVTIRSKKRQLARLAIEERVDLREALNNLLSGIREGLVACYPYNEHLSRLSRRLDRISTHPEVWAKYRPRLVQLHVNNFLQQWEAAGYPPHPHKLLQAGQSEATAETEGHSRHAEEDNIESTFYSGEASCEAELHFSEPQHGWKESHQFAEEEKLPTAEQKTVLHGEPGPSAEELEELRAKQRAARARREKLRAAQQQRQQ